MRGAQAATFSGYPETDTWPVLPGQTWNTELEASGPVADQLAGLSVRFE